MRKKIFDALLGILMVAIILAAIYYVAVSIARVVSSLDQPLIVAIVAASATVLTATGTLVVGRLFERKKEIESHFRQRKYDQYDELLLILYDLFEKSDAASDDLNLVKKLRDWQRKLILFAGPKTIIAFVEWMSHLKKGKPDIKTIILMEEFFKALRADLGVSNRGMRQGDFAHLILKNADLFIELAKVSPDISLDEMIRLEKLKEDVKSSAESRSN